MGDVRDAAGGPFRHGVASGDPLHDRVVIWTRVSADVDQASVRWMLAGDPDLGDVVAAGRTTTDRSRDLTVKVDVPGLEPTTTYWYAFEVDGQRSPTGRTRTAAAGRGDHLRLAFASCARWISGYYNVYDRIADRADLDVVLHLGDWFYEYGNEERHLRPGVDRRHVPDHELVTLDDYRDRHAQTRLDEAVQRMCAAHPLVHVFDDHEFANDRWREGAKAHDPDRDGPWEQRAEAALQAWWEWLPVRRPDPDRPEVIFRKLAFGDLVDLCMLDCRSWRDVQAAPPEMHRVERELLGREQHEWLLRHLVASDTVWRIVGNPIMVGQVHTQYLPDWLAGSLAELGMVTEEEHRPSPDQWDGYPAARARLFSDIRRHAIGDLVFVSGDVHTAWAVHLLEDPTDTVTPLGVEFVTASVTSQNLDEKVGEQRRSEGPDVEQQVMERNPHVRWCELDDHGYVVLDVDRERIVAEWWHVDTILERHPGEARKSSWQVQRGDPRLTHVAGDGGD